MGWMKIIRVIAAVAIHYRDVLAGYYFGKSSISQ